jgi:hypothetical protein
MAASVGRMLSQLGGDEPMACPATTRWAPIVAVLCLALIIASGGPAAAQPASGGDEAGLSHEEALKGLGEELTDSVHRSQSDPTIPQILSELDRNIEATRRMRQLLDSGNEITGEHVKEIAREISEIAQSFRTIADLAPGVFERRLAEISSIDRIGAAVDFRIADARSAMKELAADNEAIGEMLRNKTLPASEIEKLRLTRQANEAELHSLEAAVAAWSFFAERQGEIDQRIEDQSEDLDVFFHALKENARVYEAAARTLKLASSVREALGDLDSLKNLDALRLQLVKSWDDLMQIVDEVNDGLLLQPTM